MFTVINSHFLFIEPIWILYVHILRSSPLSFLHSTVYFIVDANEVGLEEHESVLEGRAHTDMNGTLTDVAEAQIATCNVFGVYPMPDKVVFLVGDSEEVVEDVVPTENADGLFDVSATLTIMPSSEYDNDQVTCVSQAAETAELVHNDVNSTFALDVSCKRYITDDLTTNCV